MVRAASTKAGTTWICLQRRCVETGLLTMPEDTREGSKNGNLSDEEADLSARLQSLGQRLARKEGTSRQTEARPSSKSDPSALARGFRLSTELVGGVAVGAFIGWALDRWLGISPWGMIVFLLLGFTAGVINVMRAAGVSSRPGQGPR
jgi:ATP synthase protein I